MKILTLKACGVAMGAIVLMGCASSKSSPTGTEAFLLSIEAASVLASEEPFFTEEAVSELPGIDGSWVREQVPDGLWIIDGQRWYSVSGMDAISTYFKVGDQVFVDLLVFFPGDNLHVLHKMQHEEDTMTLIGLDPLWLKGTATLN